MLMWHLTGMIRKPKEWRSIEILWVVVILSSQIDHLFSLSFIRILFLILLSHSSNSVQLCKSIISICQSKINTLQVIIIFLFFVCATWRFARYYAYKVWDIWEWVKRISVHDSHIDAYVQGFTLSLFIRYSLKNDPALSWLNSTHI